MTSTPKWNDTLLDEMRWGYFRTWQIVGRIMGVAPELIPTDLEEAAELNALIWLRQFGASQEGREMLLAPLSLLNEIPQSPLSGHPPRPCPTSCHPMRGICWNPPPSIGYLTVGLLATLNRLAGRTLGLRQPLFFRRFGLKVVGWLIRVDRGHNRANFYIPTHLRTHWGSPSPMERRTFWQRRFDRLLCTTRHPGSWGTTEFRRGGFNVECYSDNHS
jgi:hypothetical protein